MWRVWHSADLLYVLDNIDPVLDSWNRKDDPAQVRLREYLAALMSRVGPLPSGQPLYLSLEVDVKVPDYLLRFHDLENYLFPLFRPGCFRPAQFMLVAGMKKVGGGSALHIGIAQPMDGSDLSGWTHHTCSPGSGAQKKAWKERIRSSLISAAFSPISDGPVAVHLAWRGAARRNWTWLWKPTGDGMGPILGETRPYNPRDDRIVDLHLHWEPDNSLGHAVAVGLWWRKLSNQPGSVKT